MFRVQAENPNFKIVTGQIDAAYNLWTSGASGVPKSNLSKALTMLGLSPEDLRLRLGCFFGDAILTDGLSHHSCSPLYVGPKTRSSKARTS